MFFFRTKENAQRKYIDLIKEAAAKWPNWDPPRNIRPGDFGTVNKKTGGLNVEGNIYSHPDIAPIAYKYLPIEGAVVDHYQINSFEVRVSDVTSSVGANIPNDQSVVFNSRWQFNNKRGAVLLMHRPQMIHVPDEFFPAALHLSILKGKHVVCQVWNCPGFYMYLSNRASEQVTVNLRATASHPAVPGVNMNAAVSFSWSAEGSTGVRQYAYQLEPVYTPLFSLKSIRRPLLRRAESDASSVKELWCESDLPWDDLNEEGETEPEDSDNDDDDDD